MGSRCASLKLKADALIPSPLATLESSLTELGTSFRADELGAYILPGKVTDPRALLTQTAAAEQIGLGTIWAAERWENKESAAICGAVSVVTQKARIVTGVTHFITRHPLVLAGVGGTIQGLSGGRFALGFGRSWGQRWVDMGLKQQTLAAMADYAMILRRLWAGETVSYEGPAGYYPHIQMADIPVTPPPIYLAAIGPKTLAMAGQHFDGVVLHPFLTTAAVTRSRDIVHEAATKAGRKPSDVKIFPTLVVAPDLSDDEADKIINVRAATYFVHRWLAEPVAIANGWDLADIEHLLALPLQNAEIAKHSADEVRAMFDIASKALPRHWIEGGSARGSAEFCAERLRDYRRAGGDEILMHGTTPDHPQMAKLIDAYVA
jgi:5,10-methylenetetrahydromethanopterin reductase